MQRWAFVFIFLFLVFSAFFQQKFSSYLTSAVKSEISQVIHQVATDQEITLTAAGDISYSRGIEGVVRRQQNINYPFAEIKNYLDGDIVFGNLETTITQGREIRTGEMIFRSNPGTENALKEAGFTVMSLANNHTPDFNEIGLIDTLKYLNNVGIKYVGAGVNNKEAYRPIYIDVKGIRLALLAYTDQTLVPPTYEAGENNPGTAFMRTVKLIEGLIEAKENSDLVIVSMHSGIEYTNIPNDIQVNFAHTAIDNGADLVIGHHPHVVQSMEKYKDKFIVYSLGNFVFDQMWSRETREGLIMKMILTKEGVKSISFIPTVIENYSQPRIANESEKTRILKRLNYPLENGEAIIIN